MRPLPAADRGEAGMTAHAPAGHARWNRQIDRILRDDHMSLHAVAGNILSAARGRGSASLYVTSARPGEGRTTASVVLACALSVESRRGVVLVDGSPDHLGLGELFDIAEGPGWTDLVEQGAAPEDALHNTRFPHVKVIASGSETVGEPTSFDPVAFRAAVDALTERYDHVVIDGVPVLTSSRATLAAPVVDGVILTVACAETKWEVAALVCDQLGRVGGKVLGVVLNRRKYHVPRLFYGSV